MYGTGIAGTVTHMCTVQYRTVQYWYCSDVVAATLQIVHGDLKPGNLLVDDEFRVFISDFGLSSMKV